MKKWIEEPSGMTGSMRSNNVFRFLSLTDISSVLDLSWKSFSHVMGKKQTNC